MPVKPGNKEEEYFARLELEKRRKVEDEKRATMAEEEKRRLRELHFMRCPKCGSQLQEIDYKNIKIDKCFGCEGVWLDAGELNAVAQLEKISLERFFTVFKKPVQ